MKYQTLIAALVLALVASPAFAAKYRDTHKSKGSYAYDRSKPTQFYLGLNGGLTATDVGTTTYTSTGFAVNAGYSFNENFAAELTYANLGSMDLNDGRVLKTNGYSLGVVGLLPVSQFVALFGKVGYATTTFVITEINGVAGINNSSVNAMTAVGVSYFVNRKTDIRLTYDTYKIVNALTNEKDSLNLLSIGVLFRF